MEPVPPEVLLLLARLRRGELLAVAAFLFVAVGAYAYARGAPGWAVGLLWAASGATSVLAAALILPVVWRLWQIKRRRDRNGPRSGA